MNAVATPAQLYTTHKFFKTPGHFVADNMEIQLQKIFDVTSSAETIGDTGFTIDDIDKVKYLSSGFNHLVRKTSPGGSTSLNGMNAPGEQDFSAIKGLSPTSSGRSDVTQFQVSWDNGKSWSQTISMNDYNISTGGRQNLKMTFTGIDDGATDTGGKVTMNGRDAVAEIFTVDTTASNRAQADVITRFEDGWDTVKFTANVTTVYAKADGNGNTVLYSNQASANSNADSDILAVLSGFVATDDNFTTDDFEDAFVTTVEVL